MSNGINVTSQQANEMAREIANLLEQKETQNGVKNGSNKLGSSIWNDFVTGSSNEKYVGSGKEGEKSKINDSISSQNAIKSIAYYIKTKGVEVVSASLNAIGINWQGNTQNTQPKVKSNSASSAAENSAVSKYKIPSQPAEIATPAPADEPLKPQEAPQDINSSQDKPLDIPYEFEPQPEFPARVPDGVSKASSSSATNDPSKTVHVTKTVYNKEVSFTYNQSAIEDYIINDFTDHSGKKSTYFKNIPAIRAKAPEARTQVEKNLLEEFDNMVSWIISAGEEYGVDPKQIVAIIQQENLGNGTNVDAYGNKRNKMPFKAYDNPNGNGYMAITSICIVDILNGRGNIGSDSYESNKIPLKKQITTKYGYEMVELLESKGYNLDCTTAGEKKALANQIWKEIKANEDPEFNIRMGTLILRRKAYEKGGSFGNVATNYNGHPKYKYQYGRNVSNNYDKLAKRESGRA